MTTTFIKADYYIQIFLIILLVATSPLMLPLIIFAPALGAWQVFSALVKGVALNAYRYRVFALIAGLFGSGLMLSMSKHDFFINEMMASLPHDIADGIGIICFAVIPAISAIVYFRWTRKDYLTTTR